SPIANMIVRNDAMAEHSQRPRKTITEDSGANVADVHRFGDVRRTEVNHDGAWMSGRGDKGMSGAGCGPERLFQRRGLQAKIHEAGSGQLRLLAPFAELQFRQDIRGELAGVHFSLF